MNRAALKRNDSASERVLYMAMELSHKHWKLVFGDGMKRRQVTIEAGHRMELGEAIRKAKEWFGLNQDAHTVSCYEAGRDGFWVHRYLVSVGIENQVVDSSSIETNRRGRRAKTDRLDGDRLLTMLVRYWGGERGLWSVVRVPSVEEEDARRGHREMERLRKERTAHRNRLRSLLVTQGIRLEPGRDFLKRLETLSLWDGCPLPAELKGELEREYTRLKMVEEQLRLLEKTRTERLKQADVKSLQGVAQLMLLRAIGPSSAWVLVMEFFGWRRFRNRRELASSAGLTGTPYASGESRRDQGIEPSRESTGPYDDGRARLVVAALSARLGSESMVSGAFRRRGYADASGGDRGLSTSVAHCVMAVSERGSGA